MNAERFSDLAMKFCAGRCNAAERAELDAMVASAPELKAELQKLQADARLAKEVLPLLAAIESPAGEFPAYARERLRTKVRETLRRPEQIRRRTTRKWHWVLALAAGTAAVFLLLVPVLFQRGKPVVQIAMLDTAGPVRGEDSDLGVLKQQWTGSNVQTFDSANALETWQANWPWARVAAKVIYSRPAGEVRVIVRAAGKPQEKTFLVDRDLAAALRQANAFIQEQAPK